MPLVHPPLVPFGLRRRSIAVRIRAMKWETEPLFGPHVTVSKKVVRKELGPFRLWTETKARLIAEYLFTFVLVTKRGTYIDGFAGPQNPAQLDAWAARLVLESKDHPPWLKHYHLFERDPQKVEMLEVLRAEKNHPDRQILVYRGDFNERIGEILTPEIIGPDEPAFALLDQRTFECHWGTVEQLAQHLDGDRAYRIELFYFLADWWLAQAAGGAKDELLRTWWGRGDFREFVALTSSERADAVCRRLKEELGYSDANPYPINERKGGGRLVYYMIHATDHPDAPRLMDNAYRNSALPADAPEKLSLF